MKIFDLVMGVCVVLFFILFLLSGYYFPTDHKVIDYDEFKIYESGFQIRNTLIVLTPLIIGLVTCGISLVRIKLKGKHKG